MNSKSFLPLMMGMLSIKVRKNRGNNRHRIVGQ